MEIKMKYNNIFEHKKKKYNKFINQTDLIKLNFSWK